MTSASFSSAAATCCCSAGASTLLDSDKLVNANDNEANMIAPANANPNDPAAEFTPAASLTRSSEIGASV